jgi:hypothetical protein
MRERLSSLLGTILRPVSFMLPAVEGEEGGTEPQSEGVPSEPVPAQTPGVEEGVPSEPNSGTEDLNKASELDAANARILSLEESSSQEAVDARAFELLHEIMPEAMEQQPPVQPPAPEPQFAPQADPDEEISLEERMDRYEADIQRRDNETAVQGEMDQISREMTGLADKYPHMNKREVLTVMAQAGGRPVNIDKVAEQSNNSNLHQLETYHQKRMAEMRNSQPAPNLSSSQNAGPPSGAVPITRENAASTFAERLKARGFERR